MTRAPRSRRIRSECIEQVKRALLMQGYARQVDLASDVKLSLTTVNKFLTGKRVDQWNFLELCRYLNVDTATIAALENEDVGTDGDVPTEEPLAGDLDLAIDEEALNDYVERPPLEKACCNTLLQPGALVRIKAPSHMGKTSLLRYALFQLQEQKQEFQTALVNFHMVGAADFESLDSFLRWFCISVGQRLQRRNRLEELWNSQLLAPKENCTQYFEQYLLAEQTRPLILCLDQVDRILKDPQSEIVHEFLSLLRAWHERAKIEKRWAVMRLVLLYSTEVYLPMRVNQSPFNVGEPIELMEFTPKQVEALAENHDVILDQARLRRLFDMVGGHPYMLEKAFAYLKSHDQDVFETLLELAPTQAGIYNNHLRDHWTALQSSSELSGTLKRIIDVDGPLLIDPSQAYQLYSRGLIKFQGNEVVVRCRLYQQYFASQLKLNF